MSSRIVLYAGVFVILATGVCAGQTVEVDLNPPSVVESCPPSNSILPPVVHVDSDSMKEPQASLKPEFEIRGRIQTDASMATQSPKNKFIFGDLENSVGFRRARLGAQGTVGDQVRWVGEVDFAGGTIAFRDMFIGIRDLPVFGEVRIGHFREPMSLEAMTSSNDITFMERSPGIALDPARNWGVGFHNTLFDKRATVAFGIFRSGSDKAGDDFGDSNDMAYTGRITALPWFEEESDGRRLMHIGGAFSQRYPEGQVFTLNQGPQSNLLQFSTDNPLTPFVENISIPASQFQLYNLQWAMVLGSFSVQAEWDAAYIDQIGGGPIFLSGSYVDASYFLTGEHRRYRRADGAFGGPQVLTPFVCTATDHFQHKGWGAFELTARFAYLDLSNPNMPRLSNGLAQGDNLSQVTVGLNWYLNDYTRIMFNYVWAVPVDPNFGPSASEGYFVRTQIYW